MATDFGGLPDHIQLMVVGTVIVVASSWGVIKFIKPFIDHLTPKTTTTATDAVVVSAALADSRIMADLKVSVDRLNETQEKSNIINQMIYEILVKISMKV